MLHKVGLLVLQTKGPDNYIKTFNSHYNTSKTKQNKKTLTAAAASAYGSKSQTIQNTSASRIL